MFGYICVVDGVDELEKLKSTLTKVLAVGGRLCYHKKSISGSRDVGVFGGDQKTVPESRNSTLLVCVPDSNKIQNKVFANCKCDSQLCQTETLR